MRRFIPLIVLLSLLAPCAKAQWTIIHTFDSPPRVIYFLDDVGAPETGYVGLYDGELWQTNDSGKTWIECSLPNTQSTISCITFKNRDTGWIGTKFAVQYSGPLMQTNDGGNTWQVVAGVSDRSAIGYHLFSGRLFCSDWNSTLR